MPETDVSERTHRSYTTGAYLMLKHLAEDNLTKFDMLDTEKALIGECLGRIVANAEAQGIFLTIPTESQP